MPMEVAHRLWTASLLNESDMEAAKAAHAVIANENSPQRGDSSSCTSIEYEVQMACSHETLMWNTYVISLFMLLPLGRSRVSKP